MHQSWAASSVGKRGFSPLVRPSTLRPCTTWPDIDFALSACLSHPA